MRTILGISCFSTLGDYAQAWRRVQVIRIIAGNRLESKRRTGPFECFDHRFGAANTKQSRNEVTGVTRQQEGGENTFRPVSDYFGVIYEGGAIITGLILTLGAAAVVALLTKDPEEIPEEPL